MPTKYLTEMRHNLDLTGFANHQRVQEVRWNEMVREARLQLYELDKLKEAFILDGNYKKFVDERERFVSVASDAKCQVSFDKTMVHQYRLIGYENRVLNNEDFEDDKKDAGEIGAGQTITALYEIVPTKKFTECLTSASGSKDVIATFDFRYKKSLSSPSIPLQVDVAVNDMFKDGKLMPLSENLSFAAGVAAYGMILKSSEYKGNATFDMATELVQNSLGFDPHHYRADFLEIIKHVAEYGSEYEPVPER